MLNDVKKSIGWADYTSNPVKGLCPMDCKDSRGKSYCYARKFYTRKANSVFKDPTIRFDRHGLGASPKGYKIIFVGSTMELFGSWIKPEWMDAILTWCEVYKEDTFIFLTKQPQNLNKYKFPSNCEVGVSCIDDKMFTHSFVPQFKNLKVQPD